MVRLDTNLIYERVVKVLANFPEVAGAYLYGSALEGCRPDSDIDIGLVLHEEKSNEQINKELESVVTASFEPLDGHPFDIVVLDLANPIFCFRVIRDGQLIYAKNIERVTDIMEQISRRYNDVYPRYRQALEDIIAEVTCHGDRP